MREPLIIKVSEDVTPEMAEAFHRAYTMAVKHGPPLIVLGPGIEAIRYRRIRRCPRLYAALRHRTQAKVLAKRMALEIQDA